MTEEYDFSLPLDDIVQANLLEAILTDQQIPHYIRTYADRALDGLWQETLGWGRLEAPLKFKDSIMDIYHDRIAEHGA